MSLTEVQKEYGAEYYEADEEELEELVRRHEVELRSRSHGIRANAKARLHDVKNTMKLIQRIVSTTNTSSCT